MGLYVFWKMTVLSLTLFIPCSHPYYFVNNWYIFHWLWNPEIWRGYLHWARSQTNIVKIGSFVIICVPINIYTNVESHIFFKLYFVLRYLISSHHLPAHHENGVWWASLYTLSSNPCSINSDVPHAGQSFGLVISNCSNELVSVRRMVLVARWGVHHSWNILHAITHHRTM